MTTCENADYHLPHRIGEDEDLYQWCEGAGGHPMPDWVEGLPDYAYPEIAKRFFRETRFHEMEVLKDEGLYRHLRFMQPKPGSSAYWFDLITTPHVLIFRGDGESFVFSRLEDMFQFFRSGIYKDGSLHINVNYWAEKLTSNREGLKKYDEKYFTSWVRERVAEAIEEGWAPKGLQEAVQEEILDDYAIGDESCARRLIEEFSHGEGYTLRCLAPNCTWNRTWVRNMSEVKWRSKSHKDNFAEQEVHRIDVTGSELFDFGGDLWEVNFSEYDWWFLWACFAIIWGIQQYDQHKKNHQLG